MQGIADYEFARYLRPGNNGRFYLARTPARLPVDHELVVVKVVTGPTSDTAFRRAARELRAFAAVRSPHLVTLYDAGRDGGVMFYAMQHLPDGSLAAPATPPDREIVVRAVADAAEAAHALHEVGIVHHDIQPENVLLAGGRGRLADLGLAQQLAPGATMTGRGESASVEYMDPGVLLGGPASRATDVWSLGATLHRAVTGCGIFGQLPQNDPVIVLRTMLRSKPRIDDEALGNDLVRVVHDCLEPNPANRPPTSLVVAQRLRGLDGSGFQRGT